MDEKIKFRLSLNKNKKYDVYLPTIDKWLAFGDKRYQHYKTSDKIPKHLHVYKEHNDKKRRELYKKRASEITDKDGFKTYKSIYSPNYWSYNYLW